MKADPTTDNEAITSPDDEQEQTTSVPWPTEDDAVLHRVRECYKEGERALGDWYEDAKTDFEFAEGKQWSDEDVEKLNNENRVAATFNRCAPIINAVLGQEVTNRQEVRYLPRRIGEVNSADPMNDAVKWCRETCNAEDEDSDAFSDMVTCGMGWTVTRMDYERNPDGLPEVQRRDPLLMRWDTSARRKNLADAKWVQADYWMAKDAIEERWPDADVDGAVNLSKPEDRKEPHDSTEAWKYKNDAAGRDQYGDELRVIHHVEYFTIAKYRMVDPTSGKMIELSEDEYENLKLNAKLAKIELPKCVTIKTRVYWQAWTVGGVVLESGEQAAQKDFVYQCMTCYRERETGYWYGVVRMMRDPQRYANRLMSLMMSILATGPKGGMIFETGTFANQKKALRDWAKHDSAIEVNPGKLANKTFMQKEPQAMPPGAAELMQFAVNSIRDVTGVNVDMLGGADRDQPGIVEDMRTKAGLTILAKVFDALRLYRKRQGVLLAEFVERFISDGRLIRIMGPTGEQFIPLLRGDVLEYDVVVDESPASRDVKQRTWEALQIVAPMAMQAGVPIPPSILDYAPIPQSLSIEWKRLIAQKEAQGPQPHPAVQAEQVKAQARMAEQQAKAEADARVAQMKATTEAQMEQMRNEQSAQLEAIKAQKQAFVEQAQMEADLQAERFKAQMSAQLDEIKARMSLELEALKADRQQETEIILARIKAMAQIEAARISAGVDNGDQIATNLEAASLVGLGKTGSALVQGQQSVADTLGRHEQMMQSLAEAVMGLHRTVAAPRKLVRDARGKPTHSVVDYGTVQ